MHERDNWARTEQDHVQIFNFAMKYIFVEQLFVLINPVLDTLPLHNMTEFGQIHYLKIPLNNNIYADTLVWLYHQSSFPVE